VPPQVESDARSGRVAAGERLGSRHKSWPVHFTYGVAPHGCDVAFMPMARPLS